MLQVEARALHIAPVDACEKSTSDFLEWRICSAVICVRALAIQFQIKMKIFMQQSSFMISKLLDYPMKFISYLFFLIEKKKIFSTTSRIFACLELKKILSVVAFKIDSNYVHKSMYYLIPYFVIYLLELYVITIVDVMHDIVHHINVKDFHV